MGFNRYTTPGSGVANINPTSLTNVEKVYVSVVGGGGGGLYFFPDPAEVSAGGEGGAWAYGAVNWQGPFSYVVGAGAAAQGIYSSNTVGGTTTTSHGFVATGGRSGSWSSGSQTTSFTAVGTNSGGAKGKAPRQFSGFISGSAGGAGGTVNTPCGGFSANYYTVAYHLGFGDPGGGDVGPNLGWATTISCNPQLIQPQNFASGGGNGNDGTGITVIGNPGTYNITSNEFRNAGSAIAGSGVYGGGGGFTSGTTIYVNYLDISLSEVVFSASAGNGGNGLVYLGWIDIVSQSTTVLTTGQTATVTWSSPFGSGTYTAGPFTATQSVPTTVYAPITDSSGARSSAAFTLLPPLTISTFVANPNPQNSSTGVPQYSVTLNWTIQGGSGSYISTVTNLSTNQVYNNVTSGLNISNLPQSVVGSNSPASVQFKLLINDGYDTKEQTITVQVRNDNTPSNSWTQTFSNLEPNTEYNLVLGQLQGVDMPTIGTTSGSGNFMGNASGTFAQSLTYNVNDQVRIKFTSLPFNTSLSGVPNNAIYGNTNTKTIPVTIGTQSFNVTVTTRAPRIAEDFNLANNANLIPFPDIDVIPGAPNDYAVSEVMTVDDVEISSEIKTSDGNLQVNINGSGWQNVGQI